MATVDEKLDRITLLVEHLAEDVQELRSELREFRAENAKEHDILRGQIGAVAEALNTSNSLQDVRHEELKQKNEELERIQKQHSADIMALRAAI